MRGKRSISPTEQPLPFEYDFEQSEESLTARAGVPLLVQAFRSLALPGSVKRHVRLKQRQRGMDEASYVESFVVLNAVGGECVDDLEHLREDEGLVELVGHEFPSAEAGRKFLDRFHDEEKIEQAQQQLGLEEVSYIPEESAALRGLGEVNRDLVQELGRRAQQKIATIDLDSTIIESWKREALPTYQGGKGYQPLLALWAELDVVVAEEFRDGNVSGQQEPLRVARRAFQALPESVEQRWFRGDSACYEQELLRWLRNPHREGGPEGFIGFAVSARMSESLQERIRLLPESFWKPYREDAEVIVECAELHNWDPVESSRGEPLDVVRYLAIRVRRRQGTLFDDGVVTKHYAVVTNIGKWEPKRLLEWHREKAGSIEATHDVLKNELAAGVLPSGKFGANAAWLRLAVITYNVLSALKRLALPHELLRARPKRLRFLIFHTAGRIIHHARRRICRLVRLGLTAPEWREALRLLPAPG